MPNAGGQLEAHRTGRWERDAAFNGALGGKRDFQAGSYDRRSMLMSVTNLTNYIEERCLSIPT
jgi:hypothetical protein